MDEQTKQKALIGVLAFNCTVVAFMIGTGFADWGAVPVRILVGIVVGGVAGAIAFFLAKGDD